MSKSLNQLTIFTIIVVSLLSLFIIVQNPLRFHTDIAYFIDPAQRILAGERPYVDFFNVNLLTIQYLYTIPVFIAQFVNSNAASVWLFMCYIQMLLSMYISYRLAKPLFSDEFSIMAWISPMAIVMVSWASLFTMDFGQRELLFSYYLIPWFWLRYRRVEGLKSNHPMFLVFGFIVAIMTSIKPYFLFAIIGIELYLLLRFRLFKTLISPATIGFGIFSICFGLFLILNQDILAGMLDIIAVSMSGYLNYQPDASNELTRYAFQIPALVACTAFIMSWLSSERLYRLVGGLAILALMGGVVVITQTGSWQYQYALLQVGGIIVFFSVIVGLSNKPDYLMFFLCGLLALFAVINTADRWDELTSINLKGYRSTVLDIIEANTERGDDVLFLTAELNDMMPGLRLIERNQSSSYMGTWLLTFLKDESIDDNRLLQQFRELTENDINKNPKLIVIDTSDIDRLGVGSFLEESKLDETLYSQYRLLDQVEAYKIYEYFGSPPPQGIEFFLEDNFSLYSWDMLPPEDTLVPCEPIRINTWWRPMSNADVNPYSLHIDLIHNDNIVVEAVGRLGNLEDYSSQSDIIDTRELQIPCDIDAGDYNLLISLENSLFDEEPLLATGSDGSVYGRYVFLKSYVVDSE